MRKAVVEQIFVWIVLFVAFAGIFFMIIDYSIIIKANEKAASISNFAARVVAVSDNSEDSGDLNTDAKDKVIDRVNAIKGDYRAGAPMTLICNYPASNNYQIIFTTIIENLDTRFTSGVVSQSVGVYNETDSRDINCTLTIE